MRNREIVYGQAPNTFSYEYDETLGENASGHLNYAAKGREFCAEQKLQSGFDYSIQNLRTHEKLKNLGESKHRTQEAEKVRRGMTK